MAWVITARGTAEITDSTANTAISAFTPGANTLLFAWIAGYVVPSGVPTGHGTWVQVGTSLPWGDSGGGQTLRCYACKTSGSPGSSTVTFPHPGDWSRIAGVIEINENATGLPSAAADCFGTLVSTAVYTSGSLDVGVTLGAFANASNMTLILGLAANTTTLTPEAGFTSRQSFGAVRTAQLATLSSQDTTPYVTTLAVFQYHAAIGVEVKMASAAGGGGRLVNGNLVNGLLLGSLA